MEQDQIRLVSFNELHGEARKRAISDHRAMVIEEQDRAAYDSENDRQAIIEWLAADDEGVIESLYGRGYLYSRDGIRREIA